MSPHIRGQTISPPDRSPFQCITDTPSGAYPRTGTSPHARMRSSMDLCQWYFAGASSGGWASQWREKGAISPGVTHMSSFLTTKPAAQRSDGCQDKGHARAGGGG